jgi:hypothetical protein
VAELPAITVHHKVPVLAVSVAAALAAAKTAEHNRAQLAPMELVEAGEVLDQILTPVQAATE